MSRNTCGKCCGRSKKAGSSFNRATSKPMSRHCDRLIRNEAQRIVAGLKRTVPSNSPNKTHFMVELSPYFTQIASSKDTDRLFSMLPYKSLVFTGMKDRHGIYAMIGKDENRDKEVRRPRASIQQLSENKQAQAPKRPRPHQEKTNWRYDNAV